MIQTKIKQMQDTEPKITERLSIELASEIQHISQWTGALARLISLDTEGDNELEKNLINVSNKIKSYLETRKTLNNLWSLSWLFWNKKQNAEQALTWAEKELETSIKTMLSYIKENIINYDSKERIYLSSLLTKIINIFKSIFNIWFAIMRKKWDKNIKKKAPEFINEIVSRTSLIRDNLRNQYLKDEFIHAKKNKLLHESDEKLFDKNNIESWYIIPLWFIEDFQLQIMWTIVEPKQVNEIIILQKSIEMILNNKSRRFLFDYELFHKKYNYDGQKDKYDSFKPQYWYKSINQKNIQNIDSDEVVYVILKMKNSSYETDFVRIFLKNWIVYACVDWDKQKKDVTLTKNFLAQQYSPNYEKFNWQKAHHQQ